MIKREANNVARLRRHKRVRNKVSGTAECPRLNVLDQILKSSLK